MTAGDKQTNSLKCTYKVDKEASVTWDKEELMWTREDQPLSARHKANASMLTIENTGELRHISNHRNCHVHFKFVISFKISGFKVFLVI